MREYLLVLSVAAVVTFLTTPIARWIAVRWGAMPDVRDRDVHAIPIPRLGGLGVYVGMCAGVFVAHSLPRLQGTFADSSETTAVLIAGGLIGALGALDDRFDLDPLTKLVGQIACAGVLVLLGVQLAFIFIPGTSLGTVSLDPNTSFLLTTLVVVAAVNAMNFIDGLDGLLTGVAIITALGFFVYSYWLGRQGYNDVFSSPALLTAVLAGACLGFLPHNFNPARIFLGDSGSMLIGLVLAAAAISTTSRTDTQSFSTLGTAIPLIMPLLMPFAVLAIPLLDMLLAVIRRTRKGLNPFSTPDKMHLHHRLLEIGHTQRRAVIIMYIWTALLTFVGVGSSIVSWTVVLVVALIMVVVATVLMFTPRIRRRIDGGAPHVPRTAYASNDEGAR
ncbi:glycosyltransferase family 4 protein [Blastococcus sp. Marseille-P5729]|uniref:glycosyltransferase family 4 protein n=1 Tax=Blastococcus sp. Marseille-P5729 TaxID=2086582 RepID=UPI000D111E0F|nr:MraY family glycosyltransferase [Blastococcus sp. Marseille-P5729]